MTSCDHESQASLTTAVSKTKSQHPQLQELGELNCSFPCIVDQVLDWVSLTLVVPATHFPGCKVNEFNLNNMVGVIFISPVGTIDFL